MIHTSYRAYILIFAIYFIATAVSCISIAIAQSAPDKKSVVQIANPASKYCIEQGGKLVIQKHKEGGEYGVCLFKDSRQCEEWAMFRGECPVGGIDIIGCNTPAVLYCAITGGLYKTDADLKQGTCKFRNGKICDVLDYYDGKCNRYIDEHQSTYSNPFEYCAAAGTVDMPDRRYNGAKLPDSIIQNMIRQGIITADTPPELQLNTAWRCMNHQVWVCQFGANIPCMDKADKSRDPGPGMAYYCRANPAENSIPAYAAGRTTVYEWKCQNGKPEIVRQILETDQQGYPTAYWHKLINHPTHVRYIGTMKDEDIDPDKKAESR